MQLVAESRQTWLLSFDVVGKVCGKNKKAKPTNKKKEKKKCLREGEWDHRQSQYQGSIRVLRTPFQANSFILCT
jgi:hypothetical protein